MTEYLIPLLCIFVIPYAIIISLYIRLFITAFKNTKSYSSTSLLNLSTTVAHKINELDERTTSISNFC